MEAADSLRVTRAGEIVQGDTHVFHRPERATRQGYSEGGAGFPGLVVAWVPDDPLEVAEAYTLEVQTDAGESETLGFTAIEDVERGSLDLDILVPALARRGEPIGDDYCCDYSSCGLSGCYTAEELVEVEMQFDLTSASEARWALFRLRTDDDQLAENEGWDFGARMPPAIFRTPATTYCATLEVLDLVTATVTQAQEFCLEAPFATDEVGTVQPSRFVEEDFAGRRCLQAPKASVCHWDTTECTPTPRPIMEAFCAYRTECSEEDGPPCEIESSQGGEEACALLEDAHNDPNSDDGDGGDESSIEGEAPDAGRRAEHVPPIASACQIGTGSPVSALWPLVGVLAWLGRPRARRRLAARAR